MDDNWQSMDSCPRNKLVLIIDGSGRRFTATWCDDSGFYLMHDAIDGLEQDAFVQEFGRIYTPLGWKNIIIEPSSKFSEQLLQSFKTEFGYPQQSIVFRSWVREKYGVIFYYGTMMFEDEKKHLEFLLKFG